MSIRSSDSRRGLAFMASGVLARSLSHASTLILMLYGARLLSPEDFGAYVLSTALVAAGMLFIYAGVYEYLLRAAETALAADAAFGVLFAIAVVLAGLHLGGAAVAASAFHSPALAGMLWCFAVIPLTGCLSAWREALFLRDSRNLRTYNRILVMRDLASLAIGLAGLRLGYGLAALVVYRLAVALLGWLAWRIVVPRSPRLGGTWTEWRTVAAYGGGIVGTRLAAFTEANGVDILLGLLLSPAAVGVYRMASRMVAAVVDLLAQPLSKLAWVRVSEAARAGGSAQEECALWHALLLVLAWPALAFIALESQVLTQVVLGPRWNASAPVISALALVALVRTAVFSLEPLFASASRSMTMLRLRVLTASASLLAVFASARGGVEAVALAQCAVALGSVVLVVAGARAQAGLRLATWARGFARPAGILAGMGLVELALRRGALPVAWPALARLVVSGASATLLTAVALWTMKDTFHAIGRQRPAAGAVTPARGAMA